MKSYTDLEQSKKLAEILSFESADQVWERIAIAGANLNVPEELQYRHNGDMPFKYYSGIGIPCWSLSALLEEIPEVINFNDDESDYALKILKENNLYYLSYGNPLEYNKIEIEPQEHFVDTCYNMILKLHELKLL